MDPKKFFIDDRLRGLCVYCGAEADSRDHVPSKILLDEPYPENIPVAESCIECNQGFSASEEYLACFIDCVINGTTTPNKNFRNRIIATLIARPSIAKKIELSKKSDMSDGLLWQPESRRVKEVVLKLARGHIAYELGIQRIDAPDIIEIVPIPFMSKLELESFLSIENSHFYPEIGSRAFVNLLTGKPNAYEQWCAVQENRYQYSVGQSHGDWAKLILSNYLACHVAWC